MISPVSGGAELGARLAARVAAPWMTRFAPAPTGWLHIGHAVNAVFVWGLARAHRGRVALRIEDHDRGRARAECERGILDDLDWLGLEPDVARSDVNRTGQRVLRQSDRGAVYEAALTRLADAGPGLVYPCVCSRRDAAGATGDVFGTETRYPGTCREAAHAPGATDARRVILAPGIVVFNDVARGEVRQEPAQQCGDLLVRDRRGYWTYQFAVVVDDAEQGIEVVIRGEDLLASTGRQILLARLLGRTAPPVFLHHPLVRHPGGAKLSKSAGDTGLAELRRAGWSAARVLGEAVRLAGLRPGGGTIAAADLAGLFAP